jgi:hypothetical protein
MKTKIFLFIGVVLAGCLASKTSIANTGGNGATETVSKTEILGTVYTAESRKPLRDVVVTAYANNKKESRALTDGEGNYSFSDLKPGVYRLVFEREGYRKVSRDKVKIKTDDGFQLNIDMEEIHDFDWVPGIFNFSGGE